MHTNDSFTEGPIFGPLMRFALPVLAALFLQAMYGATDLLIVGRFGTPGDVSGVSTGSQIMHTLTMAVTGLSMGLTVLLSHMIGAGKRREAGQAVGAGICLFALVGALLTAAVLPLCGGIASLMQAPAEAMSQTVNYMRICSTGFVFIVAYNLLGSLFRGIGNARMPLFAVAVACVFNIAGDLLLVGVFDMHAEGAALATVLAQALSVVISLLVIRRQGLPFEFTRADVRFRAGPIRAIFRLGAPIALQDILVSLSFLAIYAIVNTLGVVASAGVGVAEKLCAFIMLVPSAFSQAMSAFVGQNIGAAKPDRARRALYIGMGASFAFGLIMFYLAFFHGDALSGLFSADPSIIAASADYLKAYAIDCLLVAFLFCFIGYFNGCGRTVFTMAQGVAGAFGVRIPVSFLMSRLPEVSLFKVGLATPCSTVAQIALCFIYFVRARKAEARAKAAN